MSSPGSERCSCRHADDRATGTVCGSSGCCCHNSRRASPTHHNKSPAFPKIPCKHSYKSGYSRSPSSRLGRSSRSTSSNSPAMNATTKAAAAETVAVHCGYADSKSARNSPWYRSPCVAKDAAACYRCRTARWAGRRRAGWRKKAPAAERSGTGVRRALHPRTATSPNSHRRTQREA